MADKLTLPNGPYRLTDAQIDRRVPVDRAGVYALGHPDPEGGFSILRVGRADTDLCLRLSEYLADPKYEACTHFCFEVYGEKKKAFEAECMLFHDHEPALNDAHPGRPRRTAYCCPIDETQVCPPRDEED